MAAMANDIAVYRGSYETNGNFWTEYELYTWVVWVGGEPHKIKVRRHFFTTVEYDGSKVSKNWQADGVTFCVKSKNLGYAFDLFVNNTKFKYLPDIKTQRRGVPMRPAAPGADIVICGNCGIAGHYAKGCATPSNRTTSRAEEGKVSAEVGVSAEFTTATGDKEQSMSDPTYDDDGFLSGLSSFVS